MAKHLRQHNATLDAETFEYLNDRYAELLKERLARNGQLPFQSHLQLAYQLLLAGNSRESIEVFGQLVSIADKDPRIPSRWREQIVELIGIAKLRLGEQENCILHHGTSSCIFPIRPDAVHELPEGSLGAVETYLSLLEEHPDNLGDRWLLNIAYMTLGQYPDRVPEKYLIPPSAFESDYPLPRYYDVAPGAGLAHRGHAGGVCMDDFNGDGLLDVVKSGQGVDEQIKYFQNNGDGTFSDLTEHALLTGEVGGLNLSHADYDNDGDVDILVIRGGWIKGPQGKYPCSLLRNRGDATFEDVTVAAGLFTKHQRHAGVWGDFNNDGYLDLFLASESARNNKYRSELFRNNGDGTFTNVAPEVGLDMDRFIKGAAWGDYDNDRRLDLYVSCMRQPNALYHNEGDHFVDVTEKAGVSEPMKSFPCWFFDFDNDGWLDILVASFYTGEYALDPVVGEYLKLDLGDAPLCHLYRNNRDGTFTDVAPEMNLARPLMVMGANFGDLDNDGFQDCYFGTGNPLFTSLVPNRMFRNDRGKRFQDVTTAGGFGHLQKGHGIAFGDLDNDGDQDIFAAMGGAFTDAVFHCALFENPGNENHWITLRFQGKKSNRFGVDARVKLVVREADGTSREIHRVVGETGSFGSASMQLEVGLGASQKIELLEIKWPVTGATDRFTSVPLDQCLEVTEGSQVLRNVALRKFSLRKPAGVDHNSHRAREL